MADLINANDSLNEGRKKLNDSIKQSERAENKSDQAVATSNEAKQTSEQANQKSEYAQTHVDTVIGASTIDPAVEQMKIGSDGQTYPSPDARIRSEHEKVTSQLAQTGNVIDKYVSPENFDTLDECILYARENDKVIQADKIELTKETNFRHVGLEVTEIVLNGHAIELGGYNGRTTKAPHQTIGRIIGSGINSENDKVYIRGMSYSTLKIGEYIGVINFRLRHGDEATYIAYSSFIFNNVTGINIGDDVGHTSTSEQGALWFNENVFYLNNVHHLKLDGSYNHNLNRFYGGCFEGQDFNKIILNIGSQNYFYDIRAEGKLDIILSDNTFHNHFHLLSTPYYPRIDDKGQSNRIIRSTLSDLRTVQIDSANARTYAPEQSNFTLYHERVDPNDIESEKTGRLMFAYGEDHSYESDFYSNPENKMAVFETSLTSDYTSVPIFYKLYNENFEEISSTLNYYYVTTYAQDLRDAEEGLYLQPGITSPTNLNNNYIVPGLTDRKRVLHPAFTTWGNLGEKPAYVKFFIGYSGARFYDVRVSIVDLKGDYGVRYFGNV